MDSKRAKEILKSSETIEVLFHGTPVWIENVNDNNSAEITYLETQQKKDVPVYKLVENNPVKSM